MFNPFSEINWRPSPAERRVFGRSMAMVFPLLAAGFMLVNRLWSGAWHTAPFLWLAGCGLGAGALFVAIPLLAYPFYLLLYFLACCVGMVVGNTLLAAFYLLFITPAGAAARVLKRQAVSKTFDRNARTYWVDVGKASDIRDYYRQF